MNGKPRRSVLSKVLWVSLFLVIGTAAILLLYWETHKKEIIRHKIESAIQEKSNGLYMINYADMKLDEIGGNATFTDMYIGYDTAALLASAEKPPMLLNIQIPSIHIAGIKTSKALFGKEITGRSIELNDPFIEIIYTGAAKPSKDIPSKEVYQEILGKLKLIKMDTVSIRHARLVTKNPARKDSIVFANLNITLLQVAVDSLSNADSTRLLFARTLDLQCEKISWTGPGKRCGYMISEVAYNSDTSNMYVRRFDVTPLLSEKAFVKTFPFQSDRFDMHYTNIKLTHVNPWELMNEKLLADSLQAGSSSIKIYCDLAIPPDKNQPANNFPQQQIMDIPFSFLIRKAVFPHTFIEYRERNDITRKVSNTTYFEGYYIFDNIVNIPSSIRANNICRVYISSSFMHIAPIKATLLLKMGDPQGYFTFNGTIGGGDATLLNPVLEPTSLIRVRKGTVKSMQVNLTGNNFRTDGSVTLLYDGLKFDVLKMDKSSEFTKKGFTSIVGNIIVKNANPEKGDPVRVGEVHHERVSHRSIINFIWKSILAGVNTTINNPRKMKQP